MFYSVCSLPCLFLHVPYHGPHAAMMSLPSLPEADSLFSSDGSLECRSWLTQVVWVLVILVFRKGRKPAVLKNPSSDQRFVVGGEGSTHLGGHPKTCQSLINIYIYIGWKVRNIATTVLIMTFIKHALHHLFGVLERNQWDSLRTSHAIMNLQKTLEQAQLKIWIFMGSVGIDLTKTAGNFICRVSQMATTFPRKETFGQEVMKKVKCIELFYN